MRRRFWRGSMRDFLWFALAVVVSGIASYLWIFLREAQPRGETPQLRNIKAEAPGPPLSLDGVALGSSRAQVVAELGEPGHTAGGQPLLYRGGSYEVYFDDQGRVVTLAGGLHLRQDGRLLLSVGDDENRILPCLGLPSREVFRQPPWYGHVRYFDRFKLKIYSHKRDLNEYFDMVNLLSQAREDSLLHHTIRGMVLGGPYFDN